MMSPSSPAVLAGGLGAGWGGGGGVMLSESLYTVGICYFIHCHKKLPSIFKQTADATGLAWNIFQDGQFASSLFLVYLEIGGKLFLLSVVANTPLLEGFRKIKHIE